MEERLARNEVVSRGWRCTVHPHVHVARVVELVAETRVRLERRTVRHVNRARSDVVYGRVIVVGRTPARRAALAIAEDAAVARRIGHREVSVALAEQPVEEAITNRRGGDLFTRRMRRD